MYNGSKSFAFNNTIEGLRKEIDHAHSDFLCEFEGLELELEPSTERCYYKLLQRNYHKIMLDLPQDLSPYRANPHQEKLL